MRVAADCVGVELEAGFYLKRQVVYDLKTYLELKLKKIQRYHPDVLRPTFQAECDLILKTVNSNFSADQVLVTDEIGFHWNVAPLRSLSPSWTAPQDVEKTRTVKTSFCVAMKHDTTHDSYVTMT